MALTTVGYGDVTPITTVGRVVTIIGVGMAALPADVATQIRNEINAARREIPACTCPRCGLEFTLGRSG